MPVSKETTKRKGFPSKLENITFRDRFIWLWLNAPTHQVLSELKIHRSTSYVYRAKLNLPRRRKDWSLNKHPKGMLGKNHTNENKMKQSLVAKNLWKTVSFRKKALANMPERSKLIQQRMVERLKYFPNSVYSNARRGARSDIGPIHFRSRWEANYARYLNLLKSKAKIDHWEYEADTFWFEKIKRGVRSYLPDFKIFNLDGSIEYHEVKGWMDDKSKTKLKRMKKYHPDVKIVLIDEKAYKELDKELKHLIPGWEIK